LETVEVRKAEHALAICGLAFLSLILYTWLEMRSDEKRRAAWLQP
jgi:hypothetical protein